MRRGKGSAASYCNWRYDVVFLQRPVMLDLEGITVIAMEQAVAAPYASGKLAQAGARVIKVERPEGDFARRYDTLVNGESAYFVWLNHGKQSICLDVRQAEDNALLSRMLEQADVFIQNLSPSAARKLQLDAASVHKRFPSLIVCAISGYGLTGPYSNQKAYDLLVQAEAGLCEINGTADSPSRVGLSVCDIASGQAAHQSILQALFARERYRQHNTEQYPGRVIEISLYHALAEWMNVPYLQYRYGNRHPGRHGLNHPSIAPYGAYPCRDEKFLLISIQNEREWENLCTQVLQQPELIGASGFESPSARVSNRTIVDQKVADVFVKYTREEVIALLEQANIAYGRLSDLDDLLQHPQNRYSSIDGENGTIDLLAPATLVDGESPVPGKVPALDEHGSMIRAEFS
jgi:crotonobetainyl-CoA:carnitine CoA-transferase CaiB-like acyl-CoA transferase